MDERYTQEVHRRMCELNEEEIVNNGVLPTLVKVANQVAVEHPVWYESFRITAVWERFKRKYIW